MVDSVELFEAISHPVRIRILKILKKQPASFASLKRQLDIESSGNLDHHLKKLGQLITVREDGLYVLTDAGKEALLSIEVIELWSERERRKIMPLGKVPREALILSALEISTAAGITWFFATFSEFQYGGLLVSAVFALLGFGSAFGILAGRRWSWKTTIVKSGLMMLASLISLSYLPFFLKTSQDASSDVTSFYSIGVLCVVFVVAEAVALLFALRRPVKDFLGAISVTGLSRRAILGGVASAFGGILTIVLESMDKFSNSETVSAFSFLGNLTILGGLAVGVGGVLILLRSPTLGGWMSVIFGLFPPAYDAYRLAANSVVGLLGIYGAGIVAVLVGALPIVGGTFALASIRKIPE